MKNRHRILLVEDNRDDVALIQHALEVVDPGISLSAVADGDQALAYLAGKEPYQDRGSHPLPELVLLDLKLPRRSGTEVLAWIRRQPGLQRLPVVVMTSSRQAANINRAYDLGANSYMVKPVGLDELIKLLENVVGYWFGMNQAPEIAAPDGLELAALLPQN